MSRWVCWKGVGEVGKGQMEHRRKFTSDTLSVRKVERDGEGGDQKEPWGERKVGKLKKQRSADMQRKKIKDGGERKWQSWGCRGKQER